MRKCFFYICVFLFASCSSGGDEGATTITPNDYSYGFSSEWFDEVEYIPLSSKGSQDYLYDVQKILMSQGGVYVLQDNNTERTIFKFDKKGNLLKSLKGTDNLDKKFYAVTDFDFFDGKIVLTDSYTQEISFFDQNLMFLNSISVSEGVGGVQNIAFLNNSTVIIRPDLENSPLSSVLKSSFGEVLDPVVISQFFGVKGTPAEGMRVSLYETFHHSSEYEKVLYTDFFNSSIYEVGPDGVTEKYSVLLDGDLWVTKDELTDMNSMEMDEQFEYLNKIDKSDLINAVYESEKYLMLSFMSIGKRYFVLFDRESREVTSILLDFNSVSPSLVDGSPPLKYFLGFTDDGNLIFFHRAEEFKQYAKSLRNEEGVSLSEGQKLFLSTADKVDEYCNVVLAILKPGDL